MKKLYTFMLSIFLIAMTMGVQSQSNQYLHFDKVDDFVILNQAGQYLNGATEVSITGWFYCDELSYGQGYMGFRSGASDGESYLIQLNNGVMECRLVTTTGLHEFVTPANTIVPQAWQHWAWVFDGTSVKLYVGGFLIGSSSASGTFSSADVPFAIGKSNLSSFNFIFGGRIDEVSAWNKALSMEEIQDMIDNELEGNEENLQLYYKFNQGEPGGNNTTITHLISEVGDGERDAELMNFALTGETSNFNGTLQVGYQAISFTQIPNQLTIGAPFDLEATATSGLDVLFEVLEGPATINGNTITLEGEPGEVVIQATQPGNGTYDPADPVINSFSVINPYTYSPEVDVRCPTEGDVHVPELDYIQLATFTEIDNPHLFNIQSVVFQVNGETIIPDNWFNGFYTAYWMPPDYGSYQLSVQSTNNYGATKTETININVTSDVMDIDVLAVDDELINTAIPEVIVEATLPSYQGAFNEITATLEVTCPPGGCGEWDRVAHVEAQGPNGEWFEIIRYITPYGVACSHTIDLTDYMWILQGKTKFRLSCVTFDNGYLWDLSFYYHTGTPEYPYSAVSTVWHQDYPFGDLANLQPVEDYSFNYPTEAMASTLKLVSSGHGWGDNNTGNAAEFHEDTHHIWVNGEQTFEQHNWLVCSPNPDGCQPQNGTWFHNRAGWCPGAIAPWFDFNMTEFVGGETVELGYIFDEDYVDYCHPNNPACVSGTTCPDCNDGYNPYLAVACNLVIFSDIPLNTGIYTDIEDQFIKTESSISVSPNPTSGLVNVVVDGEGFSDNSFIWIYNTTGIMMDYMRWDGNTTTVDLSSYQNGMYVLVIQTDKGTEVKKVTVQ